MIGKLTYEQIEAIAKELKNQASVIQKLLNGRSVPEISEFVGKVDVYSNFLENTIELNKAADLAIADIQR